MDAMIDNHPTANRLRGIINSVEGGANSGILLEGIAELNRMQEIVHQLIEAAEGLGVHPEGPPCFCREWPKDFDTEDAHVGECREMRGALRAAGRTWDHVKAMVEEPAPEPETALSTMLEICSACENCGAPPVSQYHPYCAKCINRARPAGTKGV